MESDCRIDYVSLRVPFDALDKAKFVADATERIAATAADMQASLKCYRVVSYFDQGLRKHVATLNIWGPVADTFFHKYAFHYWADLYRLDYREALDAPSLNWDEFFRVVKARNKGKMRVDLIDSPYRDKGDKRGTGGTGLIIGAPDSAKKLSYYQRAKEGPAFEYQFLGGEFRKWLNPLLRDGAPDGDLLELHVFRELQKYARAQSMRKIGMSLTDLEAGISVPAADIDYTEPEQVLTQLDLLWDVLPQAAQESFLEAHTTASPEEIADAVERVRFTAADMWDEEPEGLWDPYTQGNW